jgi:hypothetical protein
VQTCKFSVKENFHAASNLQSQYEHGAQLHLHTLSGCAASWRCSRTKASEASTSAIL